MKSVLVKPVPPFRLDLSVWALRRSPANIMDRWDGRVYRRVLVTGNRTVAVAVVQEGSSGSPEVRISWEGAGISMGHREEVLVTVRKMLGLDIDLSDFYRLASAHQPLAELAGRFAGLKPPCLPTVFETLINGFACQQLSLNVCILLLNRLCNAYGLSVNNESAFPRPADLAGLEMTDLMKLGFSGRKAEYILNIAAGIARGKMDMESLEDSDDDAILSSLLGLRGIGPWTAEYVMLRGLGRLNTIPADDVGIQNKLKKWLDLEKRPSSQVVRKMFSDMKPYRGLIYFLLLLDHLSGKGLIHG